MLEQKYLTVPQVADLLQLRQETIRRYIHCGALKAFQLPGGDYRFSEEDLAQILHRQGKENDNGKYRGANAHNNADG